MKDMFASIENWVNNHKSNIAEIDLNTRIKFMGKIYIISETECTTNYEHGGSEEISLKAVDTWTYRRIHNKDV